MSRLPIVKCTGCTACASICPQDCINMVFNDEGFLYPSIDIEKCTNCGLCEEICPLIKPLTKEEFEPKAYAAYSVDEEIRLESSFTSSNKNALSMPFLETFKDVSETLFK